jgi:hypothetical protein
VVGMGLGDHHNRTAPGELVRMLKCWSAEPHNWIMKRACSESHDIFCIERGKL